MATQSILDTIEIENTERFLNAIEESSKYNKTVDMPAAHIVTMEELEVMLNELL